MTAALTYTEEIMNEVRIYIGLNDVITKKQMFETDRYINILKCVEKFTCPSYQKESTHIR